MRGALAGFRSWRLRMEIEVLWKSHVLLYRQMCYTIPIQNLSKCGGYP